MFSTFLEDIVMGPECSIVLDIRVRVTLLVSYAWLLSINNNNNNQTIKS